VPDGVSGFEWASLLVLFLACAIPVLSMLVVAVGTGLLGWKLVARMEMQSRDLMKCLMALSSSQSGQQMAAMMESTDAQRDKLQAESNGAERKFPIRRAQ
jgi:hypothetical protein